MLIRSPHRRERGSSAISRLRAFAVLRLMIKWNLVACSIGRSPGRAPFKVSNVSYSRAMAALERVRSIGHRHTASPKQVVIIEEAMLDRKFRDPLTKRIEGDHLLHNDRTCVPARGRSRKLARFRRGRPRAVEPPVQRFGGLRALPKQQRSGSTRPPYSSDDGHPLQCGKGLFRRRDALRPLRSRASSRRWCSAWMRQGVREAASNRIGDIGHDDRNGRVRPPHRLDGLGGRRGDDVHLQAKQVGGEFRQALLATIGVPHLDYDVLTLDIASAIPAAAPVPSWSARGPVSRSRTSCTVWARAAAVQAAGGRSRKAR